MRMLVPLLGLAACGSASARLQMSNQGPTERRDSVLADGTSLRLKIIAVSLAQDVDPVTMDNIGTSAEIWLNPECNGDTSGCNLDGFSQPAGPRVKSYFDLSRPTAEVDAELESEDMPIDPGSYRYARVEMCKAQGGETQATVPTMMWMGPDMTAEVPFTSGDCGRTSLPFDPPLVVAAGDTVTVDLGYDLSKAIVSGAPDPTAQYSIAGNTQTFRACVDASPTTRACMDFPDFAPSATKQ
jgi:hypothetical protein